LITHVVIGDGEDPALDELLAASGARVQLLRLTGAPGDGRRLLAAIAHSHQVVYSVWPQGAPAA
jgi:hypothetical protein